jgi:integrase
VTTADVVALIEAVGQRSQSVAALVFTAISEIFKHGVARHAVTANPCAGISVSAICGKPEPKRQRLKLTADELRAILPALPSIGEQNALSVKILLATCTRIGELTRAEGAHVDFDRAEWFIPDANSKPGRVLLCRCLRRRSAGSRNCTPFHAARPSCYLQGKCGADGTTAGKYISSNAP